MTVAAGALNGFLGHQACSMSGHRPFIAVANFLHDVFEEADDETIYPTSESLPYEQTTQKNRAETKKKKGWQFFKHDISSILK